MTKPNAKRITKTLLRERYRRSFTIPHYTPKDWWECDVFELTKAGYFREYEIKVTKRDFLADAAKFQAGPVWKAGKLNKAVGSKHGLLEGKHVCGPAQFWFVTPEGMLTLDEVPWWAGLIEVSYRRKRWREREVKKAPRLHDTKLDAEVVQHAVGVCYYRLVNKILAEK